MSLIDAFNESKQRIYDHVGFIEDWVIYPIDDRTDMAWRINHGGSSVLFAETEKKLSSEDYYQDEIYRQRFYKKWVYRGEKYTMIIVDTRTDGNKFFAVYANHKEVEA